METTSSLDSEQDDQRLREIRLAYERGADESRLPSFVAGFVVGGGIVGAWWVVSLAIG